MIIHFIHLLLSIRFPLLVSTFHTLVVANARSVKLRQALRSSRTSSSVHGDRLVVHIKNNLLLTEYAWNLNTLWNSPIADLDAGMWEFRFLSDFRLICSSQNPIFRLLMHWKAHLFSHFRLFLTFSEFFSHMLSHPCRCQIFKLVFFKKIHRSWQQFPL